MLARLFRWRQSATRFGLLYAIRERLGFVAAKYRNRTFARALHAENLSVGKNPRFLGISNITFGHSFTALDHLWLAAVENYEGKIYRPTITIGDNVTVGDSVHIAATNRVMIGNNVLMGSRIVITDHNHGLYKGSNQSSPDTAPRDRPLDDSFTTVIEDNVWIGDGVAILPGVTVGQGSSIGANSVVVGSIPRHCLAAGVPAKVIRTFDRAAGQWIKAGNASAATRISGE